MLLACESCARSGCVHEWAIVGLVAVLIVAAWGVGWLLDSQSESGNGTA